MQVLQMIRERFA